MTICSHGAGGYMLAVLSKDGVHGLLNLGALQGVRLCHHHLSLLFGDVGLGQKVPSLNFSRQGHTMLLQAAKTLIMVCDELQQGLAASTSAGFEVGGEK